MKENLISRRANSVGRTKIRKMFELEKTLDNVISFTVGEPDFHTPEHIVRACERALAEHKTGYAPNQGVLELREAVAERTLKTHGVKYDPETEILITAGGMNALRAASEALVNQGDEVIVPDPYWCNHFHHPLMELGVAVAVPVDAASNYMYDVARLEGYITEKTKTIILNSPSNPTGRVMDRATMKKLCELCIKHDLILISDEVYEHIIYDDTEFVSPVMFDGMRERTILCNSFSKSYAMTGWRIGYAVGPADIINAMLRINENTLASPTTFAQYAAVEALRGPQDDVKKMVSSFEKRRDILLEGINKIPKLSCPKLQGAFYAFVDIRGTGLSDDEFCERLLLEKRVSVTPGSGFGANGAGHVRMSYALSEDDLREGLLRIGEFIETL
ncbi:MAG: pyridoxal phosphate-dependent aminotransferase [Oscillospiraceae bacterium]|nr:pyridoxal phosphate-dependent aminotransferase [Oscillospiraceae bacterium]MBQ4545229.1 pyridoxal phosphate-dependent aminotransferase [Oscillospiraceae bacterium]MBQ6901908.1 pyridoxal phosphate-dependent aminotransferase [Oscillospiraceae bacterium]